MFVPSFKTKRNGVPILSREEIEEIATRYILDFQPQALKTPQEFKIEEFIEFYLGMKLDFQYLSNNGIYLGMTVFAETDRIPIYCPETNTAEYIHEDAHTVIIDRRLIDDIKQEHRYRYTMGHEAGHEIFHSHIFTQDNIPPSLMGRFQQPMIQCQEDRSFLRSENGHQRSDREWMEWHSNAYSAALHMNRDAVWNLYYSCPYRDATSRSLEAIKQMVSVFNVSTEAAIYRLKDLKLITKTDSTDYQELIH